MSVQPAVRDLVLYPPDKIVPYLFFSGCPFFHRVKSPLYRSAHPDDSRHVFCSGAALALLRSSMDKRADLHACTDIQKSDALWSVQLMSAGAQHIDITFIYIDGKMTVSLHRICMEQDAMLMGDLSDLADRFYRSDLVIGIHNRDQDRIWPDRSL